MCPRREAGSGASKKQQERETRQQENKAREKKAYMKHDDDGRAFNEQLHVHNLQIRNITGDGNCLFRSFADQMEGDQRRHKFYRKKICDYMQMHREHFEPFIVDQSFDAFVSSLSQDGTYGGNECIVAFSRLFDARICIHQLNQPVWTVCFTEIPKHEIHISYHNYEHYSSVRKLGDQSPTPANIRPAMTTCDPSLFNEKKSNKSTNKKSLPNNVSNDLFDEFDVDYVQSQLTQPVDRQLIRDALNDNYGDVTAAIGYLLSFIVPVTSEIPDPEQTENVIEKIISATDVCDVELIQQTLESNNHNMNSTVESLLKLSEDEKKSETAEDTSNKNSTVKSRPVSSRQRKMDKKKEKKQRAMERHRAEILTTTTTETKSTTKQPENKIDSQTNNEQDQELLANLEFIMI